MSSELTPDSVKEALKEAKKRYREAGERTTVERGTCPICLKSLTNGKILRLIRACKHVFHRCCMKKWFKRHKCCPVCKTELYENYIPLEVHREDLLRKATSNVRDETLAAQARARAALKRAREAIRNVGAAVDDLLELNEPGSSASYFASESKEVAESIETTSSSSSYVSSGITDYLSSSSSSSDNRERYNYLLSVLERRRKRRKRREKDPSSLASTGRRGKSGQQDPKDSSESEDVVKKPNILFKE